MSKFHSHVFVSSTMWTMEGGIRPTGICISLRYAAVCSKLLYMYDIVYKLVSWGLSSDFGALIRHSMLVGSGQLLKLRSLSSTYI